MTEPTTAKAATLPGWDTRLLVQARRSEAADVTQLCINEKVGAVFVGPNATEARIAVATFRTRSNTATILLDAARYAGRNRTLAGAGLTAAWVAAQFSLSLPWALTDTGYIGNDDTAGLKTSLAQARRLGDRVITTLPLAPSWWAPGQRQILINEIGEHGAPVALVLEHKDDPFSAQQTVEGVIALLTSRAAPVTILRSDLSGLGVLAYGGAAAAIGTSSGLRHLYPIPTGSSGPRIPHTSLLWPRGLAYRTIEKLTDAIAADPDSLNWQCNCSICYGRSLEWILNSPDPHTNAYRHSVASVRMLADEVDAGRATWLGMCRTAQSYSWEVADLSGRSWEPPKSLAAWNKAVPVTVS